MTQTEPGFSETELEIEVKFFVADAGLIRDRILSLGASSSGSVFESNIRFEDAEKSFARKKSLLRLRQDNGATLTFKSPPPVESAQFKIHRELEVTVSDFQTTKRILEAAGFHAAQIYEKRRESFSLGSSMICLDELPFGNFVEIEGGTEDIRRLAGQLGLAWHRRVVLNYLKMFELIKKRLKLPFEDITFANFDGIEWIPEAFAACFEVGRE